MRRVKLTQPVRPGDLLVIPDGHVVAIYDGSVGWLREKSRQPTPSARETLSAGTVGIYMGSVGGVRDGSDHELHEVLIGGMEILLDSAEVSIMREAAVRERR